VPTVEHYCPAPPERVFAVLAQPRRYGSWVVGAHEVEAADPHWPAPGASFRHEQGLPVVNLEDTTTVLESDPPTHLRLEARVRPFVVAHVDLRLVPAGSGTLMRMEERAVGGLLAPLLRLRPAQAATRARNRVSLKRLCRAVLDDARGAELG
jgi:uncharacterized protein YndB with AHSA1/START domain